MNRAKIEKAINRAVNSTPGLSFDTLAALPYVKMQEQDYITRQTEVKTPRIIKKLSFAGALCLFIAVLISGLYIQRGVSSIITLDVNPSIEIKTNLMNKVLSVRAINKDAEEIIGSQNYKGTKLNTLVPALMNTLVEHNYINENQKAILLTVMSKSDKKAEAIRNEIDTSIKESLLPLNIMPTIMSRKLPKESGRSELAGRYGLSEGKLNLIQDIIAVNSALTLNSLADKSISRLYEIAIENGVDLSKYNITGEDTTSGDNNGKGSGNSTGNNSGKALGEDTQEGKEPAEDAGLQESDTEKNESGNAGRDNDGQDDKGGATKGNKNNRKDPAHASGNQNEDEGNSRDGDKTGKVGQRSEDNQDEDSVGQGDEDSQGENNEDSQGEDNEDNQGKDIIGQENSGTNDGEDYEDQDYNDGNSDINEDGNTGYSEDGQDNSSYTDQNGEADSNNNGSWNTEEDSPENENGD